MSDENDNRIPVQLTVYEWMDVRRAVARQYEEVKKAIRRAQARDAKGLPVRSRPSELAMEAGSLMDTWKKLKEQTEPAVEAEQERSRKR